MIISNDTDAVVWLLRFITGWQQHGLSELWMEFGSVGRWRHLYLSIFLAIDSAWSCVGFLWRYTCLLEMMLSAKLEPKPSMLHSRVSLTDTWTILPCQMSWVRNHWIQLKNTSSVCGLVRDARLRVKYLARHDLKVISVVVHQRHWLSCHRPQVSLGTIFIIRNVLTILIDGDPILSAMDYSWFLDGGTILPVKGLKPMPEDRLVLCKCGGKCDTNRCLYAKGELLRFIYCHILHSVSDCRNK